MQNKKEKMNLLVENILSDVFNDINKNYVIVSQDHKKIIREQIEELKDISWAIDSIINRLTPKRGVVHWGTLGLAFSSASAATNILNAIKNLNPANRANVILDITQGGLLAMAGFCYLMQSSEFTDERRHQWFWTGIICMAFGAVLGVTSFAFSYIQNAAFNPALVTAQAKSLATASNPPQKLLVWKMAEVVADNTSKQSFLRLVSDFVDGITVLTYQLTTNRGKTFKILFKESGSGKIPYIIIDPADKVSFKLKDNKTFLNTLPEETAPLPSGKLAVQIDDIDKIDDVVFNAKSEIDQINKAIDAGTDKVEATVVDNIRVAKRSMDTSLSKDLDKFILSTEGLSKVDISKITKEVYTISSDGDVILEGTTKIIFDEIKKISPDINEDSFMKAIIAMQNSSGLTDSNERKALSTGLTNASSEADLNLSNLRNEANSIKERAKAVSYGWLIGADDIAMATKNMKDAQLKSAMLTMRTSSRNICQNASTRLEIPLLIKAKGLNGLDDEKLIKSGFVFVADEVEVASGTILGSIRMDTEYAVRIIKQRKENLDNILKDSISKQRNNVRNNVGDGKAINSKFLNIEYDSDTLIIKISMKEGEQLKSAKIEIMKDMKDSGLTGTNLNNEYAITESQTADFVKDANNKINEVNKLNTQTEIDKIGVAMGFSGLEPGSPKKATDWLSNNFYNSPDTKLQTNIKDVLEHAMPTMEQARANQFTKWFGTTMEYASGKYKAVSSTKGKLLFYTSKFISNNFIGMDSDGSISFFGGTSEPIIENYESTNSDSIIISAEMREFLEKETKQKLEIDMGNDVIKIDIDKF